MNFFIQHVRIIYTIVKGECILTKREIIKQLTGIYSRHTGFILKEGNIDCNDLNVYVKHALKNGLIKKKEVDAYIKT